MHETVERIDIKIQTLKNLLQLSPFANNLILRTPLFHVCAMDLIAC